MSVDLYAQFEQVVCVNLDRRPDRWSRFMENVESCGWPLRNVERFSAIDGKKAPPPSWWRAGYGAWGIHQSHVQILERTLHEGIESVLILEDDAVFPRDFAGRLQSFMTAVSDDWHGIMLGGQHLRPPLPIQPGVLRVQNGNRTHSHALRGVYIKDAYRHLCEYVDHSKTPGQHVDHRLGVLHGRGDHNVYAPDPWIVGQADGYSDIAHKRFGMRFWNNGKSTKDEDLPPFVAVIGLHRSGSSCLAGVLHHLGVHMGNDLGGYEPTGGFEARELAQICERAYPFPSTELAISRKQLVDELREWITQARREAKTKGTIAGGKYPHLCAMGNELREICGDALRVIHIDRPLEQSIESLKRRSVKESGWLSIPDEQAESVQRCLWERKPGFLNSFEHLAVDFSDLLRDPASQVKRIVEFLGISSTDEKASRACRHVKTKSPLDGQTA